MTKTAIVSPDLLSKISSQPMKHRDVLIICTEDIEQIKIDMEKLGIRISDQMAELRILKAKIDYNDLVKLQGIPGIELIETDEEAQVFQ